VTADTFPPCVESLIGAAEPVEDLHEDEASSPKVIPASDAPVNEKGDEPLSNHNEEIEAAEHTDEPTSDGLSWAVKIGALAVIVALCALFIKSRSAASKEAHQYEKVNA